MSTPPDGSTSGQQTPTTASTRPHEVPSRSQRNSATGSLKTVSWSTRTYIPAPTHAHARTQAHAHAHTQRQTQRIAPSGRVCAAPCDANHNLLDPSVDISSSLAFPSPVSFGPFPAMHRLSPMPTIRSPPRYVPHFRQRQPRPPHGTPWQRKTRYKTTKHQYLCIEGGNEYAHTRTHTHTFVTSTHSIVMIAMLRLV